MNQVLQGNQYIWYCAMSAPELLERADVREACETYFDYLIGLHQSGCTCVFCADGLTWRDALRLEREALEAAREAVV